MLPRVVISNIGPPVPFRVNFSKDRVTLLRAIGALAVVGSDERLPSQ